MHRAAAVILSGSLVACAVPDAMVGNRVLECRMDGGAPAKLHLYTEHRPRGRVEVQLARHMQQMDEAQVRKIATTIEEETSLLQVDPNLVLAVIETESSFNPKAVSNKDAQGLMQLKKKTMEYEALRSGLYVRDPMDPVANVRIGTRYLARLLKAFRQPEIALIAYNAGPHRVWEWRHSDDGTIPEEFYEYPNRVLKKYRRYLRE